MMGIYEFAALSKNEQAQAAWGGTYLAVRFLNKYAVQLYCLSYFYVEIFYDRETNAIINIKSFKTATRLAPYLDQLTVPE